VGAFTLILKETWAYFKLLHPVEKHFKIRDEGYPSAPIGDFENEIPSQFPQRGK